MGLVGVILLYVGAVLLVNGMGGLGRVDGRSMAVMNFMVGALALVASLMQLFRAETTQDYFGVATFFLFTFTYLYVAVSIWFELDMRGFGWFCFFVALTTIPCAIVAYTGGDLRFGTFWLIWGALWYMFYEANVRERDFGRVLPFATIGVGVFTCWIPGLLVLTGNW
ncbi:MAG: AmiS/UreI transporter [Gammaproteobacteria bacterium]|nr:AmiS/UreI transporter [Gammaproteobacteria bacterium]MCP5201965.1 AmiS/UreI transporter [Gammaproteobacteria bacterium]